jgi:hypothetical protein
MEATHLLVFRETLQLRHDVRRQRGRRIVCWCGRRGRGRAVVLRRGRRAVWRVRRRLLLLWGRVRRVRVTRGVRRGRCGGCRRGSTTRTGCKGLDALKHRGVDNVHEQHGLKEGVRELRLFREDLARLLGLRVDECLCESAFGSHNHVMLKARTRVVGVR